MDDVPHATDPVLAQLLDAIWRKLARACADRRAGWRLPALATVDASGAPRVRTLVLRGADRAGPLLALHTDARSAKALEITREPRVALMFWDAAARQQLRAEGHAVLAPDQAAFASLPADARMIYAVDPRPGTPIAAADAFTRGDPASAFRVLSVRPHRLEWLDLSGTHRRALFDLDAHRATWLVP